MKNLFGREPALWVTAVTAVLAMLGSLGLDVLTPGAAFAIAGVANAIIIAATTRPVGPPLFTGIFTAVVALLAQYGLDLSDQFVASVSTAIVALFALLARMQISPAAFAWQTGVLGDKVVTDPNSSSVRR